MLQQTSSQGIVRVVLVLLCASACGSHAGGGVSTAGTMPVVISAATPRPRSGTWSVNYWTWPTTYGDAVTGTETVIGALVPRYLRVGGYNNDANAPDPFD